MIGGLTSCTVCDAGSICGDDLQCYILFPPVTCQTQRPRPDVSDPVESTLCVVLAVIMCRHPPGCHTLMVLSSRLKAMPEFLASRCPLILYSQ